MTILTQMKKTLKIIKVLTVKKLVNYYLITFYVFLYFITNYEYSIENIYGLVTKVFKIYKFISDFRYCLNCFYKILYIQIFLIQSKTCFRKRNSEEKRHRNPYRVGHVQTFGIVHRFPPHGWKPLLRALRQNTRLEKRSCANTW